MMQDFDYEGNTPLLLAVEGGSADITHHLLEYESDVNHCNMSRVYPLHTACTIGHLEIVKILIAVGSFSMCLEIGLKPCALFAKYFFIIIFLATDTLNIRTRH